MSKLDTFKQNFSSIQFWRHTVIPSIYHSILNSVFDTTVKLQGGYADVMKEDWDTLIVLDACRFDVIDQRINDIPGELNHRWLRGGVTGNFLSNQFVDESYLDTVYLAANPHASRFLSDEFHEIREIWKTHWNEGLSTVMPDQMIDALSDARSDFPNKRLIAHFVQPHQPYVSDWALKNLELPYGLEGAKRLATDEFADPSEIDRNEMTTYLHLYSEGQISHDTIWRAYQKNVDLVLDEVIPYITDVDERVVVTADHGELFNDNGLPYPRCYVGHYPNIRATKLNKVPWLINTGSNRPEIKQGEEPSDRIESDSELTDRLRQLGYIND